MKRRHLKRRYRARPVNSTFPDRGLITVEDPTSTTSEAYRVMRTNLFYAPADPSPRVILLTSPGPKEGKSTICANLGVVLSQAGKRTLVMDCNLHTPRLHEIFGLTDSSGIVNVLAGELEQREVLQEPLPNLKIAPVGPLPENPAELLESKVFTQLLDQARQDFDYVLIDSSHVLLGPSPDSTFAEPIIIAAHADGVLLVLDASKAQEGSVRHVVRVLETVGANVIGTALSNA